MQKFYCLIHVVFSIAVFLFTFNTTIFSQEIRSNVKSKIDYSITSDFNSKYIWRGVSCSEGYVVQPSISAEYRNFNFFVWGNIEPGVKEGKKINEIDLSFGHSVEYKKFTLETSFIIYIYPGAESGSTAELILKLSRPVYKKLSAFTIHSFNVKTYKGSYFGEAGLSAEHWFNKKTAISSTAGIGWGSMKFNEIYFGRSKSALDIAYINASATFYLSKHFFAKPKAEMQFILDKDLKEASEKNNLFNFGISIGTEF